jgi:hypothetical protein
MKKSYIYPVIDILPFYGVNTLCASEVQDGLGGGNNGGNSWNDSRAPRRTPPF